MNTYRRITALLAILFGIIAIVAFVAFPPFIDTFMTSIFIPLAVIYALGNIGDIIDNRS